MRNFLYMVSILVSSFMFSGCFSAATFNTEHNGRQEVSSTSTYSPFHSSTSVETYSQPYLNCMAEKGFYPQNEEEDVDNPEYRQAQEACHRRESIQDDVRNRQMQWNSYPYSGYGPGYYQAPPTIYLQ